MSALTAIAYGLAIGTGMHSARVSHEASAAQKKDIKDAKKKKNQQMREMAANEREGRQARQAGGYTSTLGTPQTLA